MSFTKLQWKALRLDLLGVGSEVKPRKHFRRWRSYDPTNSLRTPTMKESQLLREKKNHFLGLCFNMFKRCACPVSLTCIHTQQQAMCSPWTNLKKSSGSWLLFQIERAKVWSPRWVENDKRKRFGGVVENCEVQTLSKTGFSYQFVMAVGEACGWHRGCRSHCDLPRTSLWFAADVGARPRWPSLLVKHWSVRVVARKYSGRSRVAEGHFAFCRVKMCV